MDIAALLKQLQTQASSAGKISLDTTILTASQTAAIQKTFGLPNGKYLAIDGVTSADVRQTGDSIAIAAGTVDVLNRQALGATITFTAGSEVNLVLVVAMPKAWVLADSFPDLTGFPFDLLGLSGCAFLYSTRAVHGYPFWPGGPVGDIDLAAGLNFAADLSITALTAMKWLLDSAMPSEPLKLWGPVEAPAPKSFPVMSLSAALGVPALQLLPGLTVTSLRLALQITEPGLDSTQNVVIGIAALTTDLEFVLGFTEDATALFVSGRPLPGYSATLDNLAECTLGAAVLPKGTTFSAFLPSPLSDAFSTIEFEGFDMAVTLTPAREVTSLAFSIGERPGSSINLGLFDLTGLGVRAAWMNPLSADSTAQIDVTAQARIPVELFTEPADFSISIAKTTGWAVNDIEASYHGPTGPGAITLASIIKAIAPRDTVVPSELNDLVFTEFLLDVDPSGKTFSCSCQGTFDCTLFSQPFDSNFCLTFKAARTEKSTDYTFELTGGFNIEETEFTLAADLAKAGGSTSFQFTATATHIPLSDLIKHLFEDFSLDLSVLPEIVLSGVTMHYNTPKDHQVGIDASFAFPGADLTGECVFVAEKKTAWEFVAVASLGRDHPIDIGRHLPLVGKDLVGDFELKAGYLVIASKDAAGITVDQFPDLTIKPGISFAFDLVLAGQPHTVVLPVLTFDEAGSSLAAVAVRPAASGDNSAPGTLSIQKQIGPLFIESLGLSYTDQVLASSLDATLALGPLSITMNGFSFGSPLTVFKPSFNLSGLGLSYNKAPLTVAGEFVNLSAPGAAGVQFEGGLVIGTADFAVHAFGYYGNESGFNSMFVFGDIAYDFGGPPAFFVTGLALGFGYNSTVTLPTLDEVAAFPFVEVLPTSAFPNPDILGGANASPLDVLSTILSKTLHDPPWVHEEKGSLWLAAGITFTSFELVNSQALIVVDVGSELVIELIGTSRAQFPQAGGEVSYANIELDLLVRFAPAEGLFSLQAVLASGSYLLDKACVLTGGFAFFVWFEGRPGSPGSLHKGDFVLTLGGYSPGFTCDHYPAVPAVGFHWTMDAAITIKGGAYFALTPAALMAGGRLEATYQSGNLKAWFDAHADFIVRWKPFWFDADIGIVIGASYTIDWGFTTSTISVELGCDLQLWGPPTGGSATLDFYVISITIPFGTPKNNTQRVTGWTDVEKMLPDTGSAGQPRNVLTLSPAAGLIPNGTAPIKKSRVASQGDGAADDQQNTVWIVRGTMFAFTTSSSIPMTSATVGATSLNGSSFNVYPLVGLDSHWNNVSSAHTVTVRDSSGAVRSSSFDAEAVQSGVPVGLWGSPPENASGKPQVPDPTKLLVPNQLTGVMVRVKPPAVGQSAGSIDAVTNLACDELKLPSALLPVSRSAHPAGDQPSNSGVTISRIASHENGIASSAATAARQEVFGALGRLGYAPDANDPMTSFRDQIGCSLNAEPLLVP